MLHSELPEDLFETAYGLIYGVHAENVHERPKHTDNLPKVYFFSVCGYNIFSGLR